ncbi:GNAT family N-acetyltransferase [Gorillibacterium timonense]|uniref:GNAT family N-acetyltransferase n=1 Tax=Gorillibacterium timonense TaxID=1689269 RepID=UPI00071C29BA|nr:GNAT family N-acetyltransferase [Gorillibacterium timonense]
MIRAAVRDDAPWVSSLILDAIDDIALYLTGTESPEHALRAVEDWFLRPGNRLSYENIRVAVDNGRVTGMALMYPGEHGSTLDAPLLAHLREMSPQALEAFPAEACEDEFYLDSLAVSAEARGKGIGTELIRDFEAEAAQRQYRKASLLVSQDKPKAEALYRSLGYQKDGERMLLDHQVYYHMVKLLPLKNETTGNPQEKE